METSFSKEQLKDKDNKSSEKIFRKCVHCGFCNSTCPTYQLLGDELDGPRGRIYLIKDMLENNKPASKKIVKHIDRCLSCYACLTTCPSGVDYMHLIDHGRNHIERTYKRPIFERLIRSMLAYILPKPKVFKFLAKISGLSKPFHFLLPKKIKHMISYMPKKFLTSEFPENIVFKPSKKCISKVALLTGCVQKAISPNINDASINVLLRHGIEVHILKEIKCCGSLTHHLGKEEISHKYFTQNINAWYDLYEKEKIDAILVNTSGCGTTIKDYSFIFKDHSDKSLRKKAKVISDIALDITEYLEESIKLDFTRTNHSKRYNIAYHSACSMQHGQKVHDQPIELLKKTGNNILEVPDGHLCCGSAGTYNLLHDNIASELLKRKCDNIKKIKPDIIAAGNIGCITQIANGIETPIVHTIELIDWFTGGKKPVGLHKL